MQDIEPFYGWRDLYVSSEDPQSPFYEREYSEFEYTNSIYNYYLHPQWDFFGSETLYLKIIYADYDRSFAIIEFIGEWNDAIGNDIMFFKRDILDGLIQEGIMHFVLIGENVLNFHASDDCYYEEWFEDIGDGWIIGMNFRQHVVEEFTDVGIEFILFSKRFDQINWRNYQPWVLFDLLKGQMQKRLNP